MARGFYIFVMYHVIETIQQLVFCVSTAGGENESGGGGEFGTVRGTPCAEVCNFLK